MKIITFYFCLISLFFVFAESRILDLDLSVIDPLATKNNQENFILPGSRILYADYKLLKSNYPNLKSKNHEGIDQWLLSQTAYFSSYSIGEMNSTWAPDYPIECLINPIHKMTTYRAGDIGSSSSSLSSSSSIRNFVQLVAEASEEDTENSFDQIGWCEIIGNGIQDSTQLSLPDVEQEEKEQNLRQTTLLLATAFKELMTSRILDSLLNQYYKPASAPSPRLGVVGYYALFTPTCFLNESFYEAGKKTSQLSAFLIRQPLLPSAHKNHENISIAVEYILHQLGLTLPSPKLFMDGYHLSDFTGLSFSPNPAISENAFKKCLESHFVVDDSELKHDSLIDICLEKFNLPPGFVRHAHEKATPSSLSKIDSAIQELVTNITTSFRSAHNLRRSMDHYHKSLQKTTQELEVTTIYNSLLPPTVFPIYPEDRPTKLQVTSFISNILQSVKENEPAN